MLHLVDKSDKSLLIYRFFILLVVFALSPRLLGKEVECFTVDFSTF